MNLAQAFNRMMGERMASGGRIAMLEVVGRRSGAALRTPVGFVELGAGRIGVGAGSTASQWPRNLLATPRCRLRVGAVERAYEAVPLEGAAREAAAAAIREKYGAPAARVGLGPVFELRPVADAGERGTERSAAVA